MSWNKQIEQGTKNLKKFTPEGRALGGRKSGEVRMLNKAIQEEFKRNAKAFQAVLEDIPNFSALDVMRMAIHHALQDNNYEDAARWAKELAEYEKPKLQRVEQINRNSTTDLTDEELRAQAVAEGLIDPDAPLTLVVNNE